MNKFFYPRLAFQNIRKNKSIYLPYLLAGSMITGLYYILSSITIMVAESGAKGSGAMGYLLALSTYIAAFFSVIILFYINSFVMKQRKKELGLYCILGMERRHLSLMMMWEVALSFAATLALGILFGCLMSQMMFLVLMKIVHMQVRLTFQIPLRSVAGTAGLFFGGYGLVLFYDILVVYRTNPIALLKGSRHGEREPKARWLVALTGVATLAGGYGLAITCRSAVEVFNVFFFAVLLVIVGTYCLFTAGITALLKLLKGNRHFYYRPENFISVSGMMYRMKQNAAGLASIAILSTAVLVVAGSCTSLVVGEEDVLRRLFYRDGEVQCAGEGADVGQLREEVLAQARIYGMGVKDESWHAVTYHTMRRAGDRLDFDLEPGAVPVAVTCITREDYNRESGNDLMLAPGQAAVWTNFSVPEDRITVGGYEYQIVERVEYPAFVINELNGMSDEALLVVPSMEDLRGLLQNEAEYGRMFEPEIRLVYRYNLEGDEERQRECFASMAEGLSKSVPALKRTDDIYQARESFFQLYGSLFFVGIFMVLLFLIMTVMIIYYKQITEGFDDHDRFRIMKQVGMSDREVKKTIDRQVRQVFFLPLFTAYLHIAAAFPAVCQLLTMFQLNQKGLFALCTVCAGLLFALFYLTVYRLTARTYYEIVRG